MSHRSTTLTLSRRDWLRAASAVSLGLLGPSLFAAPPKQNKARIAITLDLEMSAQYPKREQTEWNYEKGNLDDATKRYSVEAAKLVKELWDSSISSASAECSNIPASIGSRKSRPKGTRLATTLTITST